MRFTKACKYGDIETVKEMIKNDELKIHPNCLLWAIHEGHIEIVKLLLQDYRVNPTYEDNLAIRLACDNGYTEIVKLLLTFPTVNPKVDDNYCIRIAREEGFEEIINLLENKV